MVPLLPKSAKIMGTTTQAGNLASQLGSSAIGSLVGEGVGLMFNGVNNQNQLNQQNALDQLQLGYNEQMAQFNEGEQLQLWQQTNYPAQVQELEQAGLNPALLYGSHGGGGATTGGVTGGSISGAAAPSVSPAQTAQMAIMSQEAQADINLKNAQAANLNAKTPQEGGLMTAQTLNLTQGVQNMQAQQALTQMQTTAQGIQNQIQGQTQDDQIASIRAAATQIQQQAQQAVRNNYIDAQTMNTKIQQVNANLLSTYINNQLQQSNIQVNNEQISQMANQIIQSRYQTGINQQNANTQDAQQQTNDSLMQLQKLMFSYNLDQGPVNQIMQNINHLLPYLKMNIN